VSTLFISELFPPRVGGTCRWYWELFRRLPRDKYLLAIGEHPDQAIFDRGHDLRIQRLPLDLAGRGLIRPSDLRQYGRALLALRRLAHQANVSRVIAARPHPEGWLALGLKLSLGLPYRTFALGEEVKLLPRGSAGTMASGQLRWMTGLALRSAERVIAASSSTAAILRDEWQLGADRIRVLLPGVDTCRFVPAKPDPDVRAGLGWQDRRVVLTVARLESPKGHDQLLRALPRIRAAIPDILYAVVGDGSQRSALEQLANDLGVAHQVRFYGELADERLLRCYQQCDLFVLPSRQIGLEVEGFGLVLLEAQACARAVLAGASGGTTEALQHGSTGLIVPCDTPDALAVLLPELLLDEARRSTMGRAGRRWVLDQFDFASRASATQELLEATI
jgi:phosphatidylinositol alpha-1,6-mannosyltransferase